MSHQPSAAKGSRHENCNTLTNKQTPIPPASPCRNHQLNHNRNKDIKGISDLMREISFVQGQNEFQDSLVATSKLSVPKVDPNPTLDTSASFTNNNNNNNNNSQVKLPVVPPKTYYSIRRKYMSHQPTYAIDIPLRNGGGTPLEYISAIVAAKKRYNSSPYTFGRNCGNNEQYQPPKEPFHKTNHENKYISKTISSTAFAHLLEEYEKEKKDHINFKKSNPGSQNKQQQNFPGYSVIYKEMTPNEDRMYRMKRDRLPMGNIYAEEAVVCDVLAGKEHPYHSVLTTGRQKAQEREEKLKILRNRVMDQLRDLHPVEDIIHKTDPKRDYEYAHGMKVSLALDSDSRELKKKGLRVFDYIDRDYSPIIGGQYQTARTEKEGKISRRKYLQSNDKLTIRLDKKQNFQEDMSIFAPRNRAIRDGFASMETKSSQKYSPRH